MSGWRARIRRRALRPAVALLLFARGGVVHGARGVGHHTRRLLLGEAHRAQLTAPLLHLVQHVQQLALAARPALSLSTGGARGVDVGAGARDRGGELATLAA